jgi:hypothetical protein
LYDSDVEAPEFVVWKNEVECYLLKEYGDGSSQIKFFKDIEFYNLFECDSGSVDTDCPENKAKEKVVLKRGIDSAKIFLQQL